MSRIVDQDGNPFKPSLTDSLLSPAAAFRMLEETIERADEARKTFELWELRRSCGETAGAAINIRKPRRYG